MKKYHGIKFSYNRLWQYSFLAFYRLRINGKVWKKWTWKSFYYKKWQPTNIQSVCNHQNKTIWRSPRDAATENGRKMRLRSRCQISGHLLLHHFFPLLIFFSIINVSFYFFWLSWVAVIVLHSPTFLPSDPSLIIDRLLFLTFMLAKSILTRARIV